MFAPTYFPASYFPATYFPVGGDDVAPDLPADFAAALVAAFKGDSQLSAVAGPYDRRAPAKTSGTYATFTLSGGGEVLRTDSTRVYEQSIRWRVSAPDLDAACVAGELLAARVKAWGSLAFDAGFSLPIQERGRMPAEEASKPGPNALPRYWFEFTCSARVHQAL